jgi:hypothetical protein
MPQKLHGELAHAAEREGVSLNRLIVSLLSRALAPDAAPAEAPGRRPAAAPARRSQLLSYALVVNFAVLVVTAAAAVALLVTAYR